MHRFGFSVILLFSFMLVLPGCVPRELPGSEISQAKVPPDSGLADRGSESWRDSWEKLTGEAQREGQIVIYSSGGPIVNEAMSKNFTKKYGINVEIIAAPGAVWVERVKREQRAGIYLADMYVGGPDSAIQAKNAVEGFWEPLSPILVPQIVEPAKWTGGELYMVDLERKFILAFLNFVNITEAINTNLVRPEELRSYSDLLNPKLKENIVMNNPIRPGFAHIWAAVVGTKLMNLDFLRSLVNQKPAIVDDKRISVDWLARGKYAVALAATNDITTEFIKAGAPIMRLPHMKEGTWASSGGGNLAVMSKRPHPNATRLFVNWLLTQEGQTMFSQALGAPSARLDVATSGFDPLQIPDSKVKYFNSSDEAFTIELAPGHEAVREIFSPLLR